MKFILSVALLGLASCSSVPDFKPSQPVEEAPSLGQAIELCGEYHIDGKKNAAGHALPERVSVLVPWIRCFENVVRKFPEAKGNQDFVMFFRALQSRHAGVQPPDAKVVDWPSVNYAVERVLTHLRKIDLAYSDDDRKILERQFPDYAIYLAENGSFYAGKASRVTVWDSETGIADLEGVRGEPLKARATPLSGRQKEYCKRYRGFRRLEHNVQDLREYLKALEEQTYQDVENVREHEKKARIESRIEDLQKDLVVRRQKLETDFTQMQAQSKWFRNGHCLE